MVADDEHAQKQGEAGGVEEHADEQLLLVVEAERLAVRPGHLLLADRAVLGEPLAGHEERSDHPVSHQQRHRREVHRVHGEPAQQQADRVVDRLGQHVHVRQVLGPDRRDVVHAPHHQERQGGVEERRVQGRGHDQPQGAQGDPLGVGDRQDHLPGRDRAVPLDRVAAVGRGVEDFVEDVVAGGDATGGGDGPEDRPDGAGGEQVRVAEVGQDQAQDHEHVLEPVVRPGDGHVGHDSGQAAGAGRGGERLERGGRGRGPHGAGGDDRVGQGTHRVCFLVAARTPSPWATTGDGADRGRAPPSRWWRPPIGPVERD